MEIYVPWLKELGTRLIMMEKGMVSVRLLPLRPLPLSPKMVSDPSLNDSMCGQQESGAPGVGTRTLVCTDHESKAQGPCPQVAHVLSMFILVSELDAKCGLL